MSVLHGMLRLVSTLTLFSFALNAAHGSDGGFVQRRATGFVLDGSPFKVAGVNNHYLTFGSDQEVKDVLDAARASGANVVRTFLQPVIGSLDGTVPTIWNWRSDASAADMGAKGRYMLSWDPKESRMAFNDGPDGLGRFDALITEAKARHLRLIVSFLDFWAYAGGAQQMSAWYGSTDKYTFFASDPRTRRDYQDWVRHVLLHVNPTTGLAYKDEPAIMAWDLMNEPDIHPLDLLVEWLGTMSAYVKSIDVHHLVTSGHANMAVPFLDLDVPTLDFSTWHGYPTYAKLDIAGFDALIRNNCDLARSHGKPILLEEFGLPRSDPAQALAYRRWTTTLNGEPGCPGWVLWRLVARQDDGYYPADEHDGFDIRDDGGATWKALQEAARATLPRVDPSNASVR